MQDISFIDAVLRLSFTDPLLFNQAQVNCVFDMSCSLVKPYIKQRKQETKL